MLEHDSDIQIYHLPSAFPPNEEWATNKKEKVKKENCNKKWEELQVKHVRDLVLFAFFNPSKEHIISAYLERPFFMQESETLCST